MGHIMEDWDVEWKIPTRETEQPKTHHPEVEEVRDDEEGQGNQGNSVGDTQMTIPRLGEKRKDTNKGKAVQLRKKRKAVRETTIQALTDDDLDKITDQVKELTEEAFEQATQKLEERHSDVQAQIAALRHILETTRIFQLEQENKSRQRV